MALKFLKGDRVMAGLRVAFISTMETDPWGGSEELWAGTAQQLVAQGHQVLASVHSWSPLHRRVAHLAACGVQLHLRPANTPLWLLGWRKLRRVERSRQFWTSDIAKALENFKPDLVVVSEGGTLPPIELVEHLRDRYPFAVVLHVGWEYWWPDDASASRYRSVLGAAERLYFVSERNRTLCETQLGTDLNNAEIVRNPCNVSRDARPPWPAVGPADELRMAAVGRLTPALKGQDLLIEALSGPRWSERRWQLEIFGNGPSRETLGLQVRRLGLDGKVKFCGHTNGIEDIWARNHLLVQPSRAEGLPLTIVEAMMCGRPVMATDVAGHVEVIDDDETGFIAQAPTARLVSAALERVWQKRDELEAMGQKAAERIRRIMPADAAAIFAEKLYSVASSRSRPLIASRALPLGANIHSSGGPARAQSSGS